jgi:lipopolysaccharide export LptBFGC system permease protein LptF
MMPLSEIFFLAIVLYVLYRFVFNFVVPIARTTRQVRQQFRNMQEMHNQQDPFGGTYGNQGPYGGGTYGNQGQTSQGPSASAQSKKPSSNNQSGEYIDFEEIK